MKLPPGSLFEMGKFHEAVSISEGQFHETAPLEL